MYVKITSITECFNGKVLFVAFAKDTYISFLEEKVNVCLLEKWQGCIILQSERGTNLAQIQEA